MYTVTIKRHVYKNYGRKKLLPMEIIVSTLGNGKILMKNVLVVTGSLRTILIELITWSIHFTCRIVCCCKQICFRNTFMKMVQAFLNLTEECKECAQWTLRTKKNSNNCILLYSNASKFSVYLLS